MPPYFMQAVRYKQATGIRSGGFSLIELLVVMGIISILLVAAFPIFVNNSNSARNASREIIKGYLQQARAHAIATGNATALAIPTLATDPALGARAASLVEVENTSGAYIPIKEKDATGNPTNNDRLIQRFGKLSGNFHFLSSSDVTVQQPTVMEKGAEIQVASKGRSFSCRAIIFSPNGQIVQPPSGTPIAIAIGQAAKRNGALVMTDKKDGQPVFDLLQVNRLTGRARFYQAE